MTKISTKGRYALRIMINLAEAPEDEFLSLSDIAAKENLSEKYLETIISVLVKANYVMSFRGKTGGYKLSKTPSQYRIGDILRLTEGDLAPVACLQENAEPCPNTDHCKTLPLWTGLQHIVEEYFDNITLADII